MATQSKVVTLSTLIKKDLKEAYFLPSWPSSYSKGYRFLNDKKYRVFDYPPPSFNFNEFQFPTRNLPTAGNEVPILTDRQPGQELKQHWRKWLPAFPLAVIKSIDEGLGNEVPIVTTGPLQCIPANKHSVDPDTLYKLQLKSAIPEIGAPCPRHMNKNNLTFPCLVKVDQAWAGRGTHIAKNKDELHAVLKDIREVCGWKESYVLQEFIHGINDVPSFQFYLFRTGEIYWVGTTIGGFKGFKWTSALVDWDKQDELKNMVHNQFTLPIKKYLHQHGYFGLVTFEVLLTDHGQYLIDMNPRVGGDTTHLLLAPYMAQCGFSKSSLTLCGIFSCAASKLIEKANDLNNRDAGRIIVLSVVDIVEGCQADVSVFSKTEMDVQILFEELLSAV